MKKLFALLLCLFLGAQVFAARYDVSNQTDKTWYLWVFPTINKDAGTLSYMKYDGNIYNDKIASLPKPISGESYPPTKTLQPNTKTYLGADFTLPATHYFLALDSIPVPAILTKELLLQAVPVYIPSGGEVVLRFRNGTLIIYEQSLMNEVMKAANTSNGTLGTKDWEILGSRTDNVNYQDTQGKTPLMRAAMSGNVDMVDRLLKIKGINVNQTDAGFILDRSGRDSDGDWFEWKLPTLGDTALHFAAKMGKSADIIKKLIAAGANINAQNRFKRTALIDAVDIKNTPAIIALVDAGANINLAANAISDADASFLERQTWNGNDWKSDMPGGTPFERAVALGLTDAIKKLIAKGANPNVTDSAGRTFLMNAVAQGRADVAKAFIASNAQLNVQDKDNKLTALMLAADGKMLEVIDALLKAGADTELKDKNGNTVLLRAAPVGDGEVIKRLATKAKLNVTNEKDKKGETPLILAVANSKKDAVEALVNAGADLNVKDSIVGTALKRAQIRYATTNQQVDDDIFKFLEKKGATL
jgi:ankyrin repeat protein